MHSDDFSSNKTLRPRSHTFAIAATLTAVLLGASVDLWARGLEGSTDAGTVISARAEATYQDATGESFSTASPTVTVIILAVATLAVTPDETAPSDTVVPHERVTRLFRVCNTGNTADTFSVTSFGLTAPATLNALYFDSDGSGTLSDGDAPIRLNESASPRLSPGGCVSVFAVIDTNDVPPQSTVRITLVARSNSANAVNGRGQDSGAIINAVGQGARLTDPNDSNLPPSKRINNASQAVVSNGNQFSYSISFRNSGDE